ncbi:oligosaccharide flippase family protein [Hymenobacter sp. NBH84]|nr:oligosaccharide flippase family protein [Hymenobacter sp. NBH84]
MAVTSSNVASAAVRGVQWTTAATVANALMQIGYTAVMARLLDPAAFGLVAMSGVVLRFGSYFAEMGLGHALVQRPEISKTDIRAAFTASIGLSIGVAALAWLLAPLSVFFSKKRSRSAHRTDASLRLCSGRHWHHCRQLAPARNALRLYCQSGCDSLYLGLRRGRHYDGLGRNGRLEPDCGQPSAAAVCYPDELRAGAPLYPAHFQPRAVCEVAWLR